MIVLVAHLALAQEIELLVDDAEIEVDGAGSTAWLSIGRELNVKEARQDFRIGMKVIVGGGLR